MRFDLTEPGCSPATVAFAFLEQPDTAPPPVQVVSGYVQQKDALHKDDAAQFTAAIDQAVRLSRNLRGYLDNRQAYCVERPWVLAEYTIYAAVLLTLIRERQLRREAADWTWMVNQDLIEPTLLPVSTEIEGRHISGKHGLHLFYTRHGVSQVRAQMEILCKKPHTTVVASRHALSRLLLAVPETVALPPTICELFARALTALDQRPVGGSGISNHSNKRSKLYIDVKKSSGVYDRMWQCVERLEFSGSNRYAGLMRDEKARVSAESSKDQSTLIVDGVKLSFSKSHSPFSPSRVEQAFIGRDIVRHNVNGMPIRVKPEHASPFSTKKILQALTGRIQKSSDLN